MLDQDYHNVDLIVYQFYYITRDLPEKITQISHFFVVAASYYILE